MNKELYRELIAISATVNCVGWMNSCDEGHPNFDYYLVSLFKFTEIEALDEEVTIDEAMIAYEKVHIMEEILMA